MDEIGSDRGTGRDIYILLTTRVLQEKHLHIQLTFEDYDMCLNHECHGHTISRIGDVNVTTGMVIEEVLYSKWTFEHTDSERYLSAQVHELSYRGTQLYPCQYAAVSFVYMPDHPDINTTLCHDLHQNPGSPRRNVVSIGSLFSSLVLYAYSYATLGIFTFQISVTSAECVTIPNICTLPVTVEKQFSRSFASFANNTLRFAITLGTRRTNHRSRLSHRDFILHSSHSRHETSISSGELTLQSPCVNVQDAYTPIPLKFHCYVILNQVGGFHSD